MAVEPTIAARFTAIVDNATGVAHTNTQLNNIGTRAAAAMRVDIIAAGQDPDNLTQGQRAFWAVAWANGVLRQAYHSVVKQQERAASEAAAQSTISTALADY